MPHARHISPDDTARPPAPLGLWLYQQLGELRALNLEVLPPLEFFASSGVSHPFLNPVIGLVRERKHCLLFNSVHLPTPCCVAEVIHSSGTTHIAREDSSAVEGSTFSAACLWVSRAHRYYARAFRTCIICVVVALPVMLVRCRREVYSRLCRTTSTRAMSQRDYCRASDVQPITAVQFTFSCSAYGLPIVSKRSVSSLSHLAEYPRRRTLRRTTESE